MKNKTKIKLEQEETISLICYTTEKLFLEFYYTFHKRRGEIEGVYIKLCKYLWRRGKCGNNKAPKNFLGALLYGNFAITPLATSLR